MMPSLAGVARFVPWLGRGVPTYLHPAYRWPLSALETRAGVEPRRADFVAAFLRERGGLGAQWLRVPEPISWTDLGRVHGDAHLESLSDPATLARVFAVDPSDVPVEGVIETARLACGATLAAAREALERGGPALNLLGGFHHAAPDRAAGLCLVNDVAVAIAALRAEGFDGRVAILDLDAHPPDGTALALRSDPKVWIGSLSGSDFGPLPRVDETLLPRGSDDATYLGFLESLLKRLPTEIDLAFVVAGGDVLEGDRFGTLALTEAGARARDRRVAARLAHVPSVWLPGGGYHPGAWRVLAGTALELAGRHRVTIPVGWDPLSHELEAAAAALDPSRLVGGSALCEEDVEIGLGIRSSAPRLLLGFYSASGIEWALHQLGLLAHVRRLGYENLRVEIGEATTGERFRLLGTAEGTEHVLFECVLDRRTIAGSTVLYVEWLALRNPRARFTALRPRLPGQDAPGLGLSREADELLRLVAKRLDLAGVAFRPSHYHLAWVVRERYRFVDAARQGRFDALVRDLAGMSLADATDAVAADRVLIDGVPYAWEPDEMVLWIAPHAEDRAAIAAERDRVRFTVR